MTFKKTKQIEPQKVEGISDASDSLSCELILLLVGVFILFLFFGFVIGKSEGNNLVFENAKLNKDLLNTRIQLSQLERNQTIVINFNVSYIEPGLVDFTCYFNSTGTGHCIRNELLNFTKPEPVVKAPTCFWRESIEKPQYAEVYCLYSNGTEYKPGS